MTGLLSSLMAGICYRFIPFMDIWAMGWGFLPDRGCGVRAVMILRGFLMNV